MPQRGSPSCRSAGLCSPVQSCQTQLRVVGGGRSRASGGPPLERGSLDPVGAAPPIWLQDWHRRRCPWLDRRSVLSWWRVSPSRARGTARTAWPRHTPASCRSGASSSGQGPRPSQSPPPGRPPRGGLSMAECRAAFYARVSSEAQARDRTIASQVAALRDRVAADGAVMDPDHAFIDEGHSGSSLVRPALERLRDAVAAGEIDRVYVLAPDRLARRHAHQALLMEEFRRAGVEVTFLNRPIGASPEDDLLLQIQGVIAEYERAQILERGRRGRRHAARSGSVSALAGAPYGYRYITRGRGGGVARFEIVPEEARFVRLIFAWVGLDRLSLREVCRRLQQAECRTRSGPTRWWASPLHGMIENPAYTGRAMYGRFHTVEPKPRLRPIRNHPAHSSRPTTRVPVPSEDWVAVPVPAIVDPAVAEAARAQLAENRQRKREQTRGPGWLLQGLVVCRRCGYAYYGKATPGLAERHRPGAFGYGAYRCIGSDGHRFDGKAVCANRPVRSDRLERVVWAHIEAVLNDPQRITHEYRRRLTDLASESQPNTDVGEVERRISTLRRGVGRLIDGYTDGVIERVEFEPRVADLRARIAQLEEHRDALAAASAAQRDLTLVIGRLEDFSIRVRENLDLLDWSARRDVIRLIVRRIEIDEGQVEIVFRIPPPPSGSTGGDRTLKTAHHCTEDHRTNARVDQPLPSARPRLRAARPQGGCIRAPRDD